MARDLATLLGLTTKAAYGADPVSHTDMTRAGRRPSGWCRRA